MAYHIVPNICGLKWNERLVLDALCYFADNNTKECYPSQKTIASWCDIDRKKVIDGVKGLVEKGIINTKKTTSTLIYTIKIEITGNICNTEKGTAYNTKTGCCTENGTACCTENGTQTILNELDINLRSNERKSLTVQVESYLESKYKLIEKEGKKVIRQSIPVKRKMIKNILNLFDNNFDWIKEYIDRSFLDNYVIKQCYSCLAIFSKSVIQKYLNDTKPRRYNNEQPQLPEPSELDIKLQQMSDEERAAWITEQMRKVRERSKKNE